MQRTEVDAILRAGVDIWNQGLAAEEGPGVRDLAATLGEAVGEDGLEVMFRRGGSETGVGWFTLRFENRRLVLVPPIREREDHRKEEPPPPAGTGTEVTGTREWERYSGHGCEPSHWFG